MTRALLADHLFTGEKWITGHAILQDGGMIADVVTTATIPPDIPVEAFHGCFMAPAFIDLQIYGAAGKLFSVFPEVDSLNKLKEYSNKGGAAFCLPTVATNTKEVFYKAIDAIRDYWNNDGEGILGLHIEGPWINPEKKGAHIGSLIHPPSLDEVKELLDHDKGIIRMITLAPEVCSKEIIELILSYDIIISAGHSNSTYQEARESFTSGITAITHLYNAMSPLQHREPGLVGAAMDDDSVMASIIPDGYHVDHAAIRIAKQVMKERLFVITDAVTDTTEGHYKHQRAGDKYEAAGILSGSALTMNKALKNLVDHASIELGEALRMCSLYPARLLGLDNLMGKIEPGYRSGIAVLDRNFEVISLF